MKKTVYAFLVGIDQYRLPVPPLNGCVNDVSAIADALREIATGRAFAVELRMIKDAEATREAVIDGFRSHLCRGGPDDVALFYYCGHGSQENAPPEFWHLEPDHLDETLVCYDSRESGEWDLADKELATLIAEVAQTQAHVVCILDCCHSGSGTRAIADEGVVTRRAPADRRTRPIESFLDGAVAAAARGERGGGPTMRSWNIVPDGRHVLLSACRADETAKEVRESGRAHGAFTAALLAVLRQTRGVVTYRDLLKRAEAQVRLRVMQQVPQLEATNGEDLTRLFLGGAARRDRAQFSLRFDRDLQWVVDGGAIHGIAPRNAGVTTSFSIFDPQATAAEMRTIDGALATAEVWEVRPELSLVRLHARGRELDHETAYPAVIVTTPSPAIGVHITGADDALDRLRRALAVAGDGGGPSLLVREAKTDERAALTVEADGKIWRIARAGGDRALVTEIDSTLEVAARSAVECLEHVARWQAVADLGNPDSRLDAASVEIALLRPAIDAAGESWRQTEPGEDIRLEYVHAKGRWNRPRFRLELRNHGPDDLYCAVLVLGQDFSIDSGLLPGGTEHIPAGRAVAAFGGKDLYGHIPDAKWRAGRTHSKDILKLIFSTEQFDPRLFDQPSIDQRTGSRSTRSAGRNLQSSLERIAARIHRGISAHPEEGEQTSDWAVNELVLTVVRPRDTVSH